MGFITLPPLLTLLFGLYVIVVAVFIVRENRTPQSTFAWLLLFVGAPLVGVIIYFFFGRSWHFFSQRNRLARQSIGGDLTRGLQLQLDNQSLVANRISLERRESNSPRLLMLVKNNSGSLLTEYNEVEILQDAAEKYPRLLADLKTARHSIHLEYYIWTNDEFTQEVKATLIERARAGVQVRALYDATSGKAMGKAYRKELRDVGVQIVPYLDYSSLGELHNLQYRSHRKLAIIDGAIGYVGGMNLDKEQLSGPKGFAGWRDTHLRVHGEAANALQASFVVSWYNTTRERLTDASLFPLVRNDVSTFCPVQIMQSGPDSEWRAIRQLYFTMITTATRHIYIQSPFFIPDESISEALKAAALAGIDVRIMCQPRGGSYQVPYRAALTYLSDLSRAGCKVYLYGKNNNVYFHPKTINVDSSIISVGSANMDIRSFSINYETNAVIYDKAFGEELAQDFLNDMEQCAEFTWQQYREAGNVRRFVDSVYRLASPLL